MAEIKMKKQNTCVEDYENEDSVGVLFIAFMFGIFWLMYFLMNVIEQAVIG